MMISMMVMVMMSMMVMVMMELVVMVMMLVMVMVMVMVLMSMVVMVMMSMRVMVMMELVASKRSMMHWGLCQPHQCNHPFSPKLAQRVLLNFCRIGFSQWTFSGGRICKQGQLSKRSREIHDVFLYLRNKPSSNSDLLSIKKSTNQRANHNHLILTKKVPDAISLGYNILPKQKIRSQPPSS